MYDGPMTSTLTKPTVPAAAELVEAMEQIRDAETFAEFHGANERARDLGLRLRRGFWGQHRILHPERIALVASAQSEQELREILQDINYDELML